MQIVLTPEMERLIDDKVRSGDYSSASEVVEAALRLLQQEEEDLEELRREVQLGIESGKREPLIPGNEVAARMRARVRGARR